jgi:broad specificity phosphatase PhoE
VDAALSDVDYGLWRGQRLNDLAAQAPDALAAWTHDPDATPHGGESFSQVVKRIGEWLDAIDVAPDSASQAVHDVVAVTHAPLVRAAIVHVLGTSPAVFSRIEIRPLAVVELQRSQRRGWTWRPASS